ncbi:LOW QUALITY PROTEIN: hypothetical protein V2J09_001881 [Rumex salicifolius]
MASAQVLPNSAVSSRKQEHLEAGKRRLEEFRSSRKQKAAGRVKKSTLPLQPSIADTVANDEQISDGKTIIDSVGTSSKIGDPISTTSIAVANDAQNNYAKTHVGLEDSQTQKIADPYLPMNEIPFSSYLPSTFTEHEQQSSKAFGSMYPINAEFSQKKAEPNGDYGTMSREGRSWATTSINQDDHGHFRAKDAFSDQQDGPNNFSKGSTQANISSLPHASDFGQSVHVNSDFSKHIVSDWRERKPIYDNLHSVQSVAVEESDTSSKGFNFGDRDSTSQAPLQSATHETFPRRSRPSFLDSLNIAKAPSTSGFSYPQSQSDRHYVAESASQNSFGQNGSLDSHLDDVNSQNSYSDVSYQEKNPFMNQEKYADLQQKPNEDFSTLEQHIEDLTQEKFSLQRALEASKTLAESLAAENSSLTESYNQQGGAVSQLKTDIQSLQAEISTLLAEHESIRIQYVNAQLECNAADERAKLLASEVIGLEEKALRLRSNELKLEKELERSNAEIASCKKKMLKLEREQQDLKMTIDALQEEKKLLQSKLRKASSSGQSIGNVDLKSKIHVSTSTDDLEVAHGGNLPSSSTPIAEESDPSASYSPDANIPQLLGQNGAFGFDSSAMIIPPDQVQMIQNINALLSELMVEREELTQALVAEVSTSSKLKDLNKELSRRLEAQTQRLELLTSQSMLKEKVAYRQPSDAQINQENMAYADEGDQVVERVLGWIKKLFPGGPSKRRTSKLLK